MVASGGGEEGGGGGEDEPELKQVPHLLLPHPGKTKEDWGGEVKGRKSKGGPVSRGRSGKSSLLHAFKDINFLRLSHSYVRWYLPNSGCMHLEKSKLRLNELRNQKETICWFLSFGELHVEYIMAWVHGTCIKTKTFS